MRLRDRFLAGCGFGLITAVLCHLLIQNVPADLVTFVVTVLAVCFGEIILDEVEGWWRILMALVAEFLRL